MGIFETELFSELMDDYSLFFKPKALLATLNEITKKKIITKIIIRICFIVIILSLLCMILYRMELTGWKISFIYIYFGIMILNNWPYFYIVLLFDKEIKCIRKFLFAVYLSIMYFPLFLMILFCFLIFYSFLEKDWIFFTGYIVFCLLQYALYFMFPIKLFRIRKYIMVIIISLAVVFGSNYLLLVARNSLSTDPFSNILDPILSESLVNIEPVIDEIESVAGIAQDLNLMFSNYLENQDIEMLQNVAINHNQLESIHNRLALIKDKLIYKKNKEFVLSSIAMVDSTLMIEEDLNNISTIRTSIINFDLDSMFSNLFYTEKELNYLLSKNPELKESMGPRVDEFGVNITNFFDFLKRDLFLLQGIENSDIFSITNEEDINISNGKATLEDGERITIIKDKQLEFEKMHKKFMLLIQLYYSGVSRADDDVKKRNVINEDLNIIMDELNIWINKREDIFIKFGFI